MNQEFKRKTVHITMVAWALLIGRVDPALICALAGVAFLNNLFVLPRITGRGLERQNELEKGYSLGMLIYPAVLLLISLIWYEQQVFMAIAWGAMAFGDGFAGLFGKKLGGPNISWNPAKRWSGLLGFILCGTVLTYGLLLLLPESILLDIPMDRWLIILAITMVFAALAESAPGMIDDNFTVPLSAAITAHFLTGIHTIPGLPSDWVVGLVLVLFLTIGSIATRKIDVPGGLTGGLLAASIFLGGGLTGLSMLFLFFVIGTLASHWKVERKKNLNLAQENEGKRSVRHAISNGGVAAACGLLAWFYPAHAPLALVMLSASLASATADTLSSEMGNIYGRKYINILTLKTDQRGVDGVISLEGTLFGLAGALVIAGVFVLFGGTLIGAVVIALAGAFGNVIDSVLGASLQRVKLMTNDAVNFANTLCAALFAWLLMGVMS